MACSSCNNNANMPQNVNAQRTCGTNTCEDFITNSNLVTYTGEDLLCVNIDKNDSLTTALSSINDAICPQNIATILLNTIQNNVSYSAALCNTINQLIIQNTTTTTTSSTTTTTTTVGPATCFCFLVTNHSGSTVTVTSDNCNPQGGISSTSLAPGGIINVCSTAGSLTPFNPVNVSQVIAGPCSVCGTTTTTTTNCWNTTTTTTTTILSTICLSYNATSCISAQLTPCTTYYVTTACAANFTAGCQIYLNTNYTPAPPGYYYYNGYCYTVGSQGVVISQTISTTTTTSTTSTTTTIIPFALCYSPLSSGSCAAACVNCFTTTSTTTLPPPPPGSIVLQGACGPYSASSYQTSTINCCNAGVSGN